MAKTHIRVSKRIAWFKPFIKRAGQLGVPLDRIKAITSYSLPADRNFRQHGSCTKRGRYYHIRIAAGIQTGHAYEELLLTLAHELAHVVDWDHSAERLIMEARLYLAFARLAKKLGYKGY